ncbi:MAG: hypothetical protein GDA46_06415 [Bdellovibrionales bacterium]|nr:hypothetical protein [Bdellovibrionales bacterium]
MSSKMDYRLDRGDLIEEGFKQGIEQGMQEGIEQGMQEGIEQGMQKGRQAERTGLKITGVRYR